MLILYWTILLNLFMVCFFGNNMATFLIIAAACLRSAAIIRLKPDTLLRDWHCQSRY